MMRDPSNAFSEAERKLAEYIDLLWAGREAAPASLTGQYAERLAAAARMASLMQRRRPLTDLVNLLRQEERAFPRYLLASDDGREARAAFNALGRRIRELQESIPSGGALPCGPQIIIGRRLSAVAFVLDYLQLAFDGPSFTVLCPLQVQTPNRTTRSNDDGFRDRLCEAIGNTVTALKISDSSVDIILDDCSINMDLAAEAEGPERLQFTDNEGLLSVWN